MRFHISQQPINFVTGATGTAKRTRTRPPLPKSKSSETTETRSTWRETCLASVLSLFRIQCGEDQCLKRKLSSTSSWQHLSWTVTFKLSSIWAWPDQQRTLPITPFIDCPAIQLARPSPAREQPNQWIPMPATSRPTITLQNPAQNQTTRLRISPPARQQTSHVPRPVVFPPTADRRASLPSTSSSSSSSQSNFVRRSTSPSVGANTSSTWKSRQPMECDFCNKMFSNKFNLKQVSSFLNPLKNGKVSQSANV